MTMMRMRMIKLAAIAVSGVLGGLAGNWLSSPARAQTVVPPITIVAPALTHTSCNVTVGATSFCFASDGLWQSINGAAFVQLGVAAPAGVISVNGKTGVVVLSATTTVN